MDGSGWIRKEGGGRREEEFKEIHGNKIRTTSEDLARQLLL